MKITIIGAGIAGLSSAIAFKRNGYDVEIFDSATELKEVGAGLQISPNGNKVFRELGVELRGEFAPESVNMRLGKTGKEIFEIPLREYADQRWGAPFFNILRTDIQAALIDRCKDLKLEVNLARTFSDKELLQLHSDAKTKGNLLIGADGVHSQMRKLLYPHIKPVFSKRVAYRSLVNIDELNSPPGPQAVIWAGNKKHAVTTRVDYGSVVNFVGICEEKNWKHEGWNHNIDPELVRKQFSNWHVSVYEILKRAENMKRWALLYHPSLPSLVIDNTVLIGDAAHPMLPSFAQGAVQALEDSYILSECVHQGRLDQYESIRRDRIARVQRASKNNMRLYHLTPISRFAYFNGAWVINKLKPEIIYRKLDWLYGYDPIEAMKLNS